MQLIVLKFDIPFAILFIINIGFAAATLFLYRNLSRHTNCHFLTYYFWWPIISKHETAILAAPDGTVYLVEIGSGKILWSFSSGPSIYSSYQQIPNHEGEKLNTSTDGDNFYIDCGEDWELYLHGTGLKKVVCSLV